jgi:hypothetical protein
MSYSLTVGLNKNELYNVSQKYDKQESVSIAAYQVERSFVPS